MSAVRRRLRSDALLAVVLPLVGLALLLLVRPTDGGQTPTTGPSTTALQTSSLVCPSALTGSSGDSTGATTLADGPGADTSGRLTVGLGSTTAQVGVATDRVADLGAGAPAGLATGPLVVTGAGDVAPGLAAGRTAAKPLAATTCPPVRGDAWFTGVGAGPTHDSVIELVNPVAGVAAADVTLWSANGEVDVDRLRGVSVPGGSTVSLDLGQLAPSRGSLAVQVHVDRGQLATSVVDSAVEPGSGSASSDWLPAQARPATDDLLLGLVGGSGMRTLTLLNQNADEARVTLQVVTATGVFTPNGVDAIRVPADSTAAVSLSGLLPDQVAQGAIGLQVTSSVPVTAGLRQVASTTAGKGAGKGGGNGAQGDVSALAPVPALTSSSAVVVPTATTGLDEHLLLAGPARSGSVQVSSYAADGTPLGGQAVAVKPDQGADLAVPAQTALVAVDPQGTGVHAAVLASSADGVAVVALPDLLRSGLVPDVAPGLP